MNDSMTAGPECSAAARPVRTKMPAPMMAPMPSMVRFRAPRARFSERSPVASASARSAVTDLVAHRLIRRSPQVMCVEQRTANVRLSGAVVRSFSCDRHVVRVGLPQASGGNLDHFDVALQLWNGGNAAVAHTAAEPTNHLVQNI